MYGSSFQQQKKKLLFLLKVKAATWAHFFPVLHTSSFIRNCRISGPQLASLTERWALFFFPTISSFRAWIEAFSLQGYFKCISHVCGSAQRTIILKIHVPSLTLFAKSNAWMKQLYNPWIRSRVDGGTHPLKRKKRRKTLGSAFAEMHCHIVSPD